MRAKAVTSDIAGCKKYGFNILSSTKYELRFTYLSAQKVQNLNNEGDEDGLYS
jgi:hypothetical protein